MSQVEYLTEQFYAWEKRGRGWQLWPDPVQLEPVFRPFLLAEPTGPPVVIDDGRKPTFLSRLTERALGPFRSDAQSVTEEDHFLVEEPTPEPWHGHRTTSEFLVAVPPDLEISREAAEQFLLAIPPAADPVAFELVGGSESVRFLLACGEDDEASVTQALKAYFPEVLVSRDSGHFGRSWNGSNERSVFIADFGLDREFMVPLRLQRKFDVDPLAGVVASLADLHEGETGIVQVLFQRAQHPWAREAMRAVLDDAGSPFFIDAPEVSRLAKAKVSRPLFACVLRIGINGATRARAVEVARRLTGALSTFADPLGNELIPLQDGDHYSNEHHEADLLSRRSHRSGMLLSVEELASIVHLPTSGIRDPRLLRHGRKSKRAPALTQQGTLLLGENIHDGRSIDVRLSAEQRSRHMYVIGASGTGKSTLLLNLIRQDLEKGQGLAVLDPHGDLIDSIMSFIPEERVEDVILLDPADSDFPVGFNIISATTELEQTLLSSDLVSLFQRLSTSWGDQMTSVLGNAILALLESDRGGTLVDLRRFLVEPGFRKEFLKTVRDPDVVYFWEREFTLLRGKPQASILTRLDTFLRPKPIRYMVAQKDSPLDLRRVMDEGKVLLCRLSHGAIGEENAHLLGTLIVSKLQQVAMSRQELKEEQRRPFYLYIDEFHHFVTPSMAQILSGARKYRLGLILAHQELRQLQSRSADVFAAIIANPAVRVCFRLGDEDAGLLAKGFASFDARDLQNLGIGEAIARIERADFDCNLRTAPLSQVDETQADSLRARVVANTRQRYARPREEIAAILGMSRAESPEVDEAVERSTPTTDYRQPPEKETAKPIPDAQEPVEIPTTPSSFGRGGPQHTYLQELIRRWADANGWRATIEEPVLDGLGRVDVALRQSDTSIACEIVVTSPAEHEYQNIQKCLTAGFTWVVTVCSEKRRLGHIRALTKKRLSKEQLAQVRFVSPDEMLGVLGELGEDGSGTETTVRGFRVKVRYKPIAPDARESKRGAVSAVIAKAIKRIRKARK